jgi:hypothetical protein
MKTTVKKYWDENRTACYVALAVGLVILSYYGIFSISITVGPFNFSMGSPY